MKHVCPYLIGTKSYRFKIISKSHFSILPAWIDADLAQDLDQRKARSAYALFLNEPVICCSILKSSVALSSTKAEFDALSATVC